MTWSDVGINVGNIREEGKVRCPRCPDKRADKCLSVNVIKGVWKCHNPKCGWTGSLNLNERIEQKEKKDYKKPPEWNNVTSISDDVVKWFSKRGISQQTLIDLKITSDIAWIPAKQKKVPCIQFNYFRDGELINIKSRDKDKNFCLYKDAQLIFYGLDDIKEKKDIIIVEGEPDKAAYWEVGVKNVVSVPNGASLSKAPNLEYLDNCWEYFMDAERIFIAVDDDAPGQILREELARRLGKERCYIVTFNGEKDANDLLRKDRLSLADTIKNAKAYPLEGIVRASDIEDLVWEMHKHGLHPGKRIALQGFDDLLSFFTGYWTAVTGISSHGKTTVVDHIVERLNTIHAWKAGFYSPESYPLELHFSKIARKLIGKAFNTMTKEEVKSALNYFQDNFFFIVPEKNLSLDSILDHARILVLRYGIKVLVIDAWNRLEHRWVGDKLQFISGELDKIDNFCRLYGVHCFLVAHPTKIKKNKEGFYEVPTLMDISDSAAFYTKCANGISVYLRRFDDGRSITEVYVQKVKNEHWGKQGVVELQWDPASGRMYRPPFKDDTNHLPDPQTEIDFNLEFD